MGFPPIGIRGLGTVNENGEVNNESYNMLTFDLVSNPSCQRAWVNGIYEGATFELNDGNLQTDINRIEEKKQAEQEYVKYLKELVESLVIKK